MLAGALTKLGPAFLTEGATMRTRYRAAANGCIWQLGTSGKAPEDLVMRTAQECELVADIEIAEQARVYERVIASMEREIMAMNEEVLMFKHMADVPQPAPDNVQNLGIKLDYNPLFADGKLV